MNRIVAISGGLTFIAVSPERAAALMLVPMTRSRSFTRFGNYQSEPIQYISVEAREGVTTGISAADRAKTVALIGDPTPQPRALIKPGHIFPVETRKGGVLVKTAIAEGALDIVRLSGGTDAGMFVDLLNHDGSLMNADQARGCATEQRLPVVTLSELIRYRLRQESLVERVAEATLPTTLAAEVRAIVYKSRVNDIEHIALVKGDVKGSRPVLLRVQTEHTVADVFGGTSPSTRNKLQYALREIHTRGRGVLLYLRRPFNDMAGNSVQELNMGTSQRSIHQMREFGVGAQILRDLEISTVELLASSPHLLEGLSSFGISVVAQNPIPDLPDNLGHTV